MTYNFDPDRWFENEKRLLDRQLKQGVISLQRHSLALDDLIRRYDRMVDRLDGTYQID